MRKLFKRYRAGREPDNPAWSRAATGLSQADVRTPFASKSSEYKEAPKKAEQLMAVKTREYEEEINLQKPYMDETVFQGIYSPPANVSSRDASSFYSSLSLQSHGDGLEQTSTLSTEVPSQSIYAVQQHAAAEALEVYAAPASVSSRDASSFSYPLPTSQPVLAALSSPSLRSHGDGLERTPTLSTEVPSESVYAVQQNAAVTEVPSESVHAVQQDAAAWSVTNTPGPGIEANPELMVLSSKEKDGTLSKTDLKPTVVAVLGLTGAGKSTFIRNVTRSEDVTIGHGYRSETSNVKGHSAMLKGTNFLLVDTPGFNDTYRSDEEVFKNIADWLADSFKAQEQLHGIIYLYRIDIPRVSGSALRSIRILELLCGQEVYPNITLAITGWEVLDETTRAAREKELSENDDFWRGLLRKGAKMVHLPKDADAQRQMFLEMEFGEHVALQIQKKMTANASLAVDDNFAEAGLSKHLDGLKLTHDEQMQDLQQKHSTQIASTETKFAAESSRIQADKKRIEEQERQLREKEAQFAAKIREEMKKQKQEFEAERRRAQEEMEQRLKAMEEAQKETLARAQALAGGPSSTDGVLVVHRTSSLEQQPRSIRRELSTQPKTYMEQMKDSLAQARAQDAALQRAAKGRLLAFTFDTTRVLRGFCDVCFKSLGVGAYLKCTICVDRGGFACCKACREEGKWCLDDSHDMTWNNRELLSSIAWLWRCKHASNPPGYDERFCNACNRLIKGVYTHCCECQDDDFDLCLRCAFAGKRCMDRKHVFHEMWAPIHCPDWKQQGLSLDQEKKRLDWKQEEPSSSDQENEIG